MILSTTSSATGPDVGTCSLFGDQRRYLPVSTAWLWADWMVRRVPSALLTAAGGDLDLFWFNNQPALANQCSYRHWVGQTVELERIVDRTERLGLQYHNTLDVEDRQNARVGADCLDGFTVPTFLLGSELLEPRLFAAAWSLTQAAAEAWWLSTKWRQPEDYSTVIARLVDPVRELELFWPYSTFTENFQEWGVSA